MTTSRVFVVEWENANGTGGGSFPMFVSDALATLDDALEEANAYLRVQGLSGVVKSATEYIPAKPKTLMLFRTMAEFDGSKHLYHMEIVDQDTMRGTGKWVVFHSEFALEIHPNRPFTIELPGGLP